MGEAVSMISSPVVELTEESGGVALIQMRDTANRNTFTGELVQGLNGAFAAIAQEKLKAVILTGYDSYFATGGTQEGLLQLSEGKGRFTDTNLYSLALECPVPVIAAMQGHGIGGGFVMGLFADFVILSRESIYAANFMKYGFTPGMGATYILPKKLGVSLGHEMLISAKTYYGEVLHERGVSFPVLPRVEVGGYALELAKTIADKPRIALTTLKRHLVAELRVELAVVIQQELTMHEETFHQPEVKERIRTLFRR